MLRYYRMGGYANLLLTLGVAIKFIGPKGSFFAENSFLYTVWHAANQYWNFSWILLVGG